MKYTINLKIEVEVPDDWPRYSAESRKLEFDRPSLPCDANWRATKMNDVDQPYDVLGAFDSRMVFYFADDELDDERRIVVVDSELTLEGPHE